MMNNLHSCLERIDSRDRFGVSISQVYSFLNKCQESTLLLCATIDSGGRRYLISVHICAAGIRNPDQTGKSIGIDSLIS